MADSTRTAIPVLRFEQRSTVDWLEQAIGFALSEVTPDDQGGLHHVQLWWGNDCLMGSTQITETERAGSASIYLTVASDDDVDAAYDRAITAGAVSVRPPEDQPYGGRGATVSDPEGNSWSFGSYLPAPPT